MDNFLDRSKNILSNMNSNEFIQNLHFNIFLRNRMNCYTLTRYIIMPKHDDFLPMVVFLCA